MGIKVRGWPLFLSHCDLLNVPVGVDNTIGSFLELT